jgi:polysaccharide export outer membrane protein
MPRVPTLLERLTMILLGMRRRLTRQAWLPTQGLCLSLCGMVVWGCTSPPQAITPVTQLPTRSAHPPTPSAVASSGPQDGAEFMRFHHLRQTRLQTRTPADYPIGPGDVLEIVVPAMEELQKREVRVTGEGTIALPLIGEIHAAGLTEAELRQVIQQRLAVYMHAPQFNLFVREYRSRQVAVIGAVNKPGVYNLASETDTILDMVAQAGGMTQDAAQQILFIPAELAAPGEAHALAGVSIQTASQPTAPPALKQANPLSIDLRHLTHGGQQVHLSLPARPGDVIIVPVSGQVLLHGWVEKPGAYKITPGLTVLGALAAAGGPHFAADTRAIRVMRTGKHGEKTTLLVDLEGIKQGDMPDLPMQEADVIEVPASTAKLVPYSFYRFFTSLVHVGASIPLY